MNRIPSSSQADHTSGEPRYSTAWLMTILVGSVFIVETLVMVILPFLPPMSDAAATLLDASLLSIILFPIFYFQAFRPLVRNIAERKQGEIRLRALLDTSVMGVIVIDQQCRIVEFNPASEAMFGYTRDEVIGNNVNMLMPEPARSLHDTYVQNYKVSGVGKIIGYSRDVIARRRDGSTFPMELFVDQVNTGSSSLFIGFLKDVTERKRMEETLVESEEKYRELFDNANDFVYSTDMNGVFVSANRSLANCLGYDRDELIGAHISMILAPESLAIAQQMTARKLAGEADVTQYELEIVSKDGHATPVELNTKLVHKDGNPVLIQGTGRDITERRKGEEAQRLAALVFKNSNEAVMITNEDNCIISVNPSFTRLTGYAPDEVIGRNPRILSSGRQDQVFYRQMWEKLSTTGKWQGELWNKRKDGGVFAEWLSINTILDANNSVYRRVAIFSDITEKKEFDELIWRHANFDTLTQLPNRRLFGDRLEQEIRKSSRVGLPMALMFIDLDKFKEVNDTLGHAQGDLLLVEAARRITECVRESDTVARMGGDEFTVILSELDDVSSVERIAQNVIDVLARPFQLSDGLVEISASIGISLYPDDAAETEELLKHADKAMYASKNLGRNRFVYFSTARPSSPS